ncbi:carboxypeptidase regulatory-like domain-containing protein [Filimonas effusa]|uniref:Carboxypeptidase regulatory-like domain-containing protein n=1 Tax=Filimonas effusa TaxID=2508721 RepID=A0A4Q1DCW1_9BACT|nr:carboxypeptidase regulatory-like domain-containing protein [Filimonas effusa]RXK87312.1 carboxypeptidase regulatory-like domain-containing protein [Filimonas effusa]
MNNRYRRRLVLTMISFIAIGTMVALASVHSRLSSYKIKGVITKDGANTPIAKAYIVAVSGEEETLSAVDGSFSLTTSQALPAVIVVQHPDFQTEKIEVRDPSEPFKICLKLR